jgi:hypothetical protein
MLANELRLTEDQRQQVQAIFDRMNNAARPLGMELIGHELLLDGLFAAGEVTPDRLAVETAAIGTLQGSLRSVHLAAHLQTRALLNADQIALYNGLRGYDSRTTISIIDCSLRPISAGVVLTEVERTTSCSSTIFMAALPRRCRSIAPQT